MKKSILIEELKKLDSKENNFINYSYNWQIRQFESNKDSDINVNELLHNLLSHDEIKNEIVEEIIRNLNKEQFTNNDLNRFTYRRKINKFWDEIVNNFLILFVKLDGEFNVHSIDKNDKSEKNNTYLHVASKEELNKVVKTLLKHGANIEAENSSNYRPLNLAVIDLNEDVVETLLEHGANPMIKNPNTQLTLLEYAMKALKKN